MSGHITRMSRGSSVGSSCSSPTSTSRSTSTWRAAPWHACTWTDRSSASWTRAARVSASGWALARRSDWSQDRRVVVTLLGCGDFEARRWRSSHLNQRSERSAELAAVAAQGGEQRVLDLRGGVVVGAGDDATQAGQVVPQLRRRLRQPDVYVAGLAQRPQQLDLGHREAGVAEQRQPGRELEPLPSRAQARDGLGVAEVRRRLGHPRHQPPPQLGLPQQVVVERGPGAVGVAALAPVGDQARSLHGVRRVEAGQPAGDGVAAVASQQSLVANHPVTEMGGKRRAPRLVEAGVDHLEQRPHQPVGVPRVVALAAEQHRHQRPRAEEPHPRADTVATPGARAEPVGQPLGQPALHTLGRHHHDLLRERVVERGRQQLAEGIGELVGARSAVDLEGHVGTLRPGADGWFRDGCCATSSTTEHRWLRRALCARLETTPVRRPGAGP